MKTIKHTYSYDAYGNLLSEYKRGNGQGQAKEDWAYQYDELNRLVQAHEDHGNQTRNYQYDSLGNLTCEWNSNNVVVDYKLNNLNQITTKSDDGWKTWTDYSYDKRGNNTKKVYYKNKKALTVGAYEYDESNRMVKGINDIGEQSIYHFNGLGILATNEWMIKKNAYGYHDVTEAALTTVTAQDGAESEIVLDVQNRKKQVKSKKPAEEVAASPELNKTSHVIKDFVIDYNSDAEENLMEYERYDEGLTYRYVYGVDKLGVTAYTILNGSASVTTDAGEIPLYYHMDHMGSSEFLTSDVTQRVTSWTSYDEWGNITHNAVLKCGTRELDLVKTYTGHERDSVLGQYYAKARMYDTADKHGSSKGNKLGDKRFTAVDPVKGNVRNPQSLVQYTYVLNNPLMYVDPLGMWTVALGPEVSAAFLLKLDFNVQLAFDGDGNIGILRNGGLGVGTPSAGVGGVATFTTASSLAGLEGSGYSTGLSLGVGGDFTFGNDAVTGEPLMGIQVSGGLSLPFPEAHGGFTKTKVSYLFLSKNVKEKLIKMVNEYFDSLDCETRKKIETMIGTNLKL